MCQSNPCGALGTQCQPEAVGVRGLCTRKNVKTGKGRDGLQINGSFHIHPGEILKVAKSG